MGAERAFRLSRSARGVKDGGVVIRRERNLRKRPRGQLRPGVHIADDLLHPENDRVRQLVGAAAHANALERGTVDEVFGDALETLGIDESNLSARIDETV